jgi:hypothetical protein
VYSNLCEAQTSGPLCFDQLPWFTVASRLQAENALLLERQAGLRLDLEQHQVCSWEVYHLNHLHSFSMCMTG